MKKILPLISLLFCSLSQLHAQSALLGAGGEGTGIGGTASSSLGELSYTTIDATFHAAQGVQQAYERNGGESNWNGSISNSFTLYNNWTPEIVPVSTSNINIPTGCTLYPMLTSTETVNNMAIASSANINISPNAMMTVNGSISNNAGAAGIYIQSSASVANGSLIFHNTQDNPVAATVEMYSKAFKDVARTNNKWQYIGIPVRSMVSQPTMNGAVVRRWDEPSYKWVLQTNADALTSFTGYEITQPAPKTYIFQGNLENNSLTNMALTYHGAVPADAGWNLIGNPYTAAIDINKISFGSETQATVILYNTGSPANWTAAGGTGGDGAGQYLSVPKNTAEPLLPTQIPSMQAFFVVANSASASATISIPYSAVGTVLKNNTLQRSSAAAQVCTRIDVKGESFTDRMWIFTNASCSHGFDNGWDGIKSFGTALAPQLFAMEPDGDYQVNTVDDINNTPLGFQAGVDTVYTFTFTHQNLEMQYSSLYLLDLLENITTDISASGTQYLFTATKSSTPTTRFRIVSSLDVVTDLEGPLLAKELKVFSSGNTIFVNNGTAAVADLVLYDITGCLLQKWQIPPYGISNFNTNFPSGNYIAKVAVEETVVTTRIILK